MIPASSGATAKSDVTAPWPIVKFASIDLTRDELSRISRLTDELSLAEPDLRADWFRQKGVSADWKPGPTVYLEDHRGIELATEISAKSFEYRSLGLVSDGDFLVVSEPRNKVFENYVKKSFDIRTLTILGIPKRRVANAKRLGRACAREPDIMQILVEAARKYGGLNIVPFMSTGDVWRLGCEIAHQSRQAIRIAAPPPQLAGRVNNKLWFATLVEKLVGRRGLPSTYEAYGLASAAATIRRLTHNAEQIVVKAPASAGGMGNLVFPCDVFEGLTLAEIGQALLNNLHSIGWRDHFPILLGVWEQNVITSPSVQIWAPLPKQGFPIIEGVFVQAISGDAGEFVGAEPADIPPPISEQLKSEAFQIACALQRLGYFGRLSLDAVFVGDLLEEAEIHWVEANARWGGVSIPMTIANKVNAGAPNRNLLIVQKIAGSGRAEIMKLVTEELGAKLISLPENRRRGVLFLLPPESGHLLFSVIGLPADEAKALANETIKICKRFSEY